MQLANETPFSPFVFETLGPQDQPWHVVFCRGTFDIQTNGQLTVADEQQPVVLADKYRTAPLFSSVEIDTDLVPFKAATDITLNAVAHAPNNEPATDWLVHFQIGSLTHSLRVLGPRFWKHTLLRGWHLTEPEPVSQVPIHFEVAFGGKYQRADDEEVVFEENPVGRGFADPKHADRQQQIPAPQIELADEPIRQFGKAYRPAGWGPIAKHWLPRRNLCGTADDAWKATRWPMRPVDFDFKYYQSAPTGLIYPGYLRGDEAIRLVGLQPHHEVTFRLPSAVPILFAMEQNHRITLEPMRLDTLHIDTLTNQVSLTWRLPFPKTADLMTVQLVRDSIKTIQRPQYITN